MAPPNPFLTPESNYQGCDTDALWQLVPFYRDDDDLRYLRLSNPALTLKVANPAIVSVDVQTPKWGGSFRTVVLKGLDEGFTTIDIILPSSSGNGVDTLLQQWTVEVGFEIQIPVQYHIVKGLVRGSEQTRSSATLIFNEANNILRRQANVSILAESGDKMRRTGYGKPFLSTVAADPEKEKKQSNNQLGWLVYDVLKSPQYFHVFFVKDVQPGSSQTGKINGFYPAAVVTRGVMIVKDRPASGGPAAMGRTVAHEFAHARKLEHSTTVHSRTDILMWGSESPASASPGEFLTRAEIEGLRKL